MQFECLTQSDVVNQSVPYTTAKEHRTSSVLCEVLLAGDYLTDLRLSWLRKLCGEC